jgi:hypothetical protein
VSGKKASRLLKLPLKVCSPHEINRAVRYGTGQAGGKNNSQNPELKELCARYAAMTKRFNQSGLAKHDLRELQKEAGKFCKHSDVVFSWFCVMNIIMKHET